MQNINALEINLEGMEESLKVIEKRLNEIVNDDSLTKKEMKEKASGCLEAVNRFTTITNRNVRLLNEQAYFLLKKVRSIEEKALKGDSAIADDSEFDIN